MKLGWNRLKKALQRFFPSGSWLWFPFQRLLSVLRRQLRSNESPVERRPEKNVERVTPPNLQLNLSSNHFSDSPIRKSHELFMAAVAAIILQSGLIAIALITVYHEPTRDSLGSAPKPWGLPCYVAGTILLSLGVGIYSRGVERSTTEKVYRIPGGWSAPRKELKSAPRLCGFNRTKPSTTKLLTAMSF